MKSLNKRIEDKADLDILGLIKSTPYTSPELNILIKHINLYVKDKFDFGKIIYKGKFEYSIRLSEYSREGRPFTMEADFYYEYETGVRFYIVTKLRKEYYFDGELIDLWISEFNSDSFKRILQLGVSDILKGQVVLSKDPNHFLYNMTFIDTLAIKSQIQGEIKFEDS